MRILPVILAALSLGACARSRTTLQAPPQAFSTYGVLQIEEIQIEGKDRLSAQHRSLAEATAISVRSRLNKRMEGSSGLFRGDGPPLALRIVLRGFQGETPDGITADASFVDPRGGPVARVEASGGISRKYYAGEVAVTARRVADAVWDFVLEHGGLASPHPKH